MIVFIAMGIAFIIYLIFQFDEWNVKRKSKHWSKKYLRQEAFIEIFGAFGLAIVVGMASFLMMIAGTAIFPPKQKAEIVNTNLVYAITSHKKDTPEDGYIGRTIINGVLKYVYIIDGPEGLQLKTAGVEHTYIFQDDSVTPHVEMWRKEYSNKICSWLFLLKKVNDGQDTIFYIPKETLLPITDYVIELG